MKQFFRVFIVGKVDQVLVELRKLFKDSPFLVIIEGWLSYFNSRVNHFHDIGSIVAIIPRQDGLSLLTLVNSLVLDVKIITNFDPTGINEVNLLIFCTIDFCDNFSHTRSSPNDWCLRIAICQVNQNVMKDVINLME